MTGRSEVLSFRSKRRTRRTARHLIRQDELVISHIIKNKTGVTASSRKICRVSTKQDFSYGRTKKQLPLTLKHREQRLEFAHKYRIQASGFHG